MTNTTEARRLARDLEGIFVSEDVSAVKARAIAAMLRALADESDSLRAQVEALRADAERYQRWREEVVTAFCDTKLLKAVGDALDPADVDAAIDAARSQEAAG